MNRNDHPGNMTGSEARAAKRYRYLRRAFPEISKKRLQAAAATQKAIEIFLRKETR